MPSARSKTSRIQQIEALLLEHKEGLSQAEIARRLGVHRSTVNRYLPDLPGHIYVDDLDGGLWKIDRSAYLMDVRFNLHEATAVHLAARLLASSMDRHNPHAAAALRKLAVSLEKLAPHICRHLGRTADEMDAASLRQDPAFLGVLERLTLAWAEGRRVRLWHRHENSQVYEYAFEPYFIEPSAIGHSMHAIGLSQSLKGSPRLRTFKLERIERVEPSREHYTIPPDFDPYALLGDAWGIWYTGEAPVTVRLRFSPAVAARVQENVWHASEGITPQPDGSLLWEARIAQPIEMLPWVRGWGSDVEVLEPQAMRARVMEEARKMAEMYRNGEQKNG